MGKKVSFANDEKFQTPYTDLLPSMQEASMI